MSKADNNRRLLLRDGASLPMPLLVPSFSSKGFPTFKDDEGVVRSETDVPLGATLPILEESLLVSAFDLHHGFLSLQPETLNNTSAIFIDSGGYETTPFFESTEPVHHPFPCRSFSLENYASVLQSLPERLPFVIASPDWHTLGQTYSDQLSFAQEFLADYPFTSSFILKPEGNSPWVAMERFLPFVENLNAFDMVGITEKELGKNLKDRLRAVAKLRRALNRCGLNALPIHVWGGLDPVITPLFFFAGADVFDGLSWLRYTYHRGVAIYRDAWQVLERGVSRSYGHARMEILFHNLGELRRLTASLRMFNNAGRSDFGAFEWHRKEFERAYRELEAEIPEIQEV